jgi:hypothetical protein
MRGPRLSRLGTTAASVLVVLVTLVLVRAPASGAPSGLRPLVLPSALPSLPVPLPSLPVPSLPLPSLPLPSVSIPLPSVSLPLPSASVPLPSVSQPLPSVSLPLPSLSQVQTASAPASREPGSDASDSDPVGSAVASADASVSRSASASTDESSGRGRSGDQRPPTAGKRAASAEASTAESPSWLVPSLAFGVPLVLVIGALIAQLLGGAAVLGVTRRVLSRFPGPMPRWMRGASDPADGS